ncbi:MAG: hypothetical protein BWZ04_03091 [Firmicutes bacterium ADurb.BinA205]|nr:MAG: hypothetical protein BWZ04_03091 [Firmicutes bacterium ADurb.BinA205]
MLHFVIQKMKQGLQLQVMLRCDVCYHKRQQLKRIRIALQLITPCFIVHISKVNLYLFADGEVIVILVINIKIAVRSLIHIQISFSVFLKAVNG